MTQERFIAADWGTTNRRLYLIEKGEVVWTERDDLGVAARPDFEGEIGALRARFGAMPILLAGMVGSSIGWRETPYVPAPADLKALAAQCFNVGEGVHIVPGVALVGAGRADVMRGEEVQILGAAAAGLVPADALLIQPGTHSKWAEIRNGVLTRFTTAMTGELFGLLRQHSILASALTHRVDANEAFDRGVREGLLRDLSASLFGIRAAILTGGLDPKDASSFASGLLIGAEVAARLGDYEDGAAYILADAQFGALYAAALAIAGREAHIIDSHAAFLSGIIRIESLLP
ncbi:2-oxo-3-deoxygalactonate kinase [Sphingobium amiense]|uniref:2-oxo-3-deoxygalactonate kinase n=1 Tax=Sphingobium amiense TaxID=135719 RepID=A0A494W0Q0_9SPHN|nr:2-dehydro-3-deoxygalactonokinase [Sphingobium amiense]BBD96758.1 2-oxo-3-deoxygalactonate kinase [Sphingobium amiense]